MDAFIAKHLQGVSRTYALLVPMLPNELADAVGAAYLLMRIVDTLEDAPGLSTPERLALFGHVTAALRGDAAALQALTRPLGESDDERALMCAAPEVFAKLRALDPAYGNAARACADAMSSGVCQMIAQSAARGRPYPAVCNNAELREYCYYVAGVVGEMLCAMMAHYLKLPALTRQRSVAVELGIGLQLVNILKDAHKDSAQGRRYLPSTAGDRLSDAAAYATALGMARECLQRGISYVLALPASARELRTFCGLPIAWGALTLARAAQDPAAAKIGRAAIATSIEQFARLAADDQGLRQWLTAHLAPPAPPMPVPTR